MIKLIHFLDPNAPVAVFEKVKKANAKAGMKRKSEDTSAGAYSPKSPIADPPECEELIKALQVSVDMIYNDLS